MGDREGYGEEEDSGGEDGVEGCGAGEVEEAVDADEEDHGEGRAEGELFLGVDVDEVGFEWHTTLVQISRDSGWLRVGGNLRLGQRPMLRDHRPPRWKRRHR